MLRITDVNGGEDFDAVQKGLDDYNEATGPDVSSVPLNVYAKEGDLLVGGLCAMTFWNWLHVGQVWVRESRRGEGFGRTLMQTAEDEARRRGCTHVYLDTVNLQAPGFYEKLGYRVIGMLNDFPPGERKFFMTKDL